MHIKYTINKRVLSIILILVIGLAVVPLTPALAASEPDDGGFPRLEKLLQHEQTVLERQQERLDRTDENISRVENLIEKAKSKGLDTQSLEDALATYQGRLPAIHEHHAKAASLLATRAGFDDKGKVIDRDEAIKTLRSAGEALRRFHLEITEATMDLRAAIRAFLEANRPAELTASP